VFWRCLHCETHNAPERHRCLICGSERLYTAGEVAAMASFSFNGLSGTQWWTELPKALQTALRKQLRFEGQPDAETLLRIRFAPRLDLSRKNIDDVAALTAMPYLERLNLSGTRVVSVAPLASLKHLEELRLDGAPVESIAPLQSLPRLRRLYLRACPALPYRQIIEFGDARPDCKIVATPKSPSPSAPKSPLSIADAPSSSSASVSDPEFKTAKRSFFSWLKRK
jgi:hypothetical protein